MSNPNRDPLEDAAAFVEAGMEIPPRLAAALRRWAEDTTPEWLDFDLVRFADLQIEHVEWVIPGLIPEGMLSVLAGQQGLGKSLLHVQWAAGLSKLEQASVLVSAEDSPTHTTKARLHAAGADQKLVYHAKILPVFGNGKDPEWMGRLRRWITATKARLLIFDPMMAFIDAASDSYKAQHVRGILSQLDLVAQEFGCAIVYIMHGTKGETRDPLKWIAGSGAWTEAARSVVLLAPEDTPQQPQRILAHVKCNVAEKAISQCWEVVPILIPDLQGKDVKTARIEYRGVSDVDTYTLLAPREIEEGKSEREEAREIIVSMLSSGECLSSDLERSVRESGISSRTYDTARRELGVRAVKRGKSWYSQLSQSKDATGKDANAGLRPSFPLNEAEEFPF